MAVTMKDVAERCGMSRPTVNLVLSGKGHLLRPETVAKVMAAAAELGYRRNAAARAMRLGRFANVGLINSTGAGLSNIPIRTLVALTDRLAAADHHLLFMRTPDLAFTEAGRLPQIATQHCVDGVILNRIFPADDPVAAALDTGGTPAVWFNIEHPVNTVRPDDEQAGRLAAERLLALGHRRIVYVNPLHTLHISAADRCRGYLAAMAAAGAEPEPYQAADPSVTAAGRQAGHLWFTAMFRRERRPTAVIINGTVHLAPILQAAALAGLEVPRDLSVVAIDGEPLWSIGLQPSLVRIPEDEMGVALAELMLARLTDPATPLPTRRVPCGWQERNTVAPAIAG